MVEEAGLPKDWMTLELRIVTDPCRNIPKPKVRTFSRQGGDIGRAPHSYWVLPDPKCYVSAQHCSVEFRDGVFWLRDCSRNGVYVNGSQDPVGKGNEVALQHGDRIRLAEYEVLARLLKRNSDSPKFEPGVDAPGNEQLAAERHATAGEYLQRHSGAAGERSVNAARSSDAGATTVADNNINMQRQNILHSAHSSYDVAGSTQPEVTPHAEPGREAAIDRFRHKDRDRAHEVPAAPEEADAFKVATLDEAAMRRHCVLLAGAELAVLSAYKILRTRVRRRMSAHHWRSVGLSGAAEGAGKTLTAINLAIVFAQDNRSPCVLVDLDLARPKIGEYLGMRFDKGLSDYLLGEARIEDIVYSVGIPGLTVVPNARPIQHASELLATPRMTDLVRYLESLRQQPTIIYDLPPLLMSDDVLVFSPHVDCVLDVVAVGITSRASIERSKEILAELNVVGVVLNRATAWEKTSHYYY
jgi:protein-tyrosine kinase